jgi:hypothetical protein
LTLLLPFQNSLPQSVNPALDILLYTRAVRQVKSLCCSFTRFVFRSCRLPWQEYTID